MDSLQPLMISSSAIGGAAKLIRSYGVDPEIVARLAQLDLQLAGEINGQIPLTVHLRFLNMAATACKEPQFGIELAFHQGLELLGPIWILARHAETVGARLESIGWALGLHSSALSLQIHRQAGNGALLDYHVQTDSEDSDLQGVEHSLALLCNEIRLIAGTTWQPRYVQFRHAPPKNLDKHHKAFGKDVYFNQDANAFFVDQNTLDLRVHADKVGYQVLRQHLRTLRDLRGDSLSTRVSQVVQNLLTGEGCSVRLVASALGMNQRTLQHQLSKAGTSYQEILDDARSRLAQRYLKESGLSVGEIAELLRFSEASAFSRFFTRHAGTSPRRYREQETVRLTNG